MALVATALNFPFRQPAAVADTNDVPSSFGNAPLGEHAFETEPIADDLGNVHPNFRHSVVSGGVHSVDDVERAVSRDEVVRDHYAGVSTARLSVVRAPARREAYMSYRIGDRVYWTSKKIALAEGEAILTDGETTIRARCGNLISDQAMAPTSSAEPDASTFDAIEPAPAVATAQGIVGPAQGVGGGGALIAPGGVAPPQAQGGPSSNSAGNVGPAGFGGSGGTVSPGPTQRQPPEGGSSDPSLTDGSGPNPPESNGPPTFGGGPNGENNPPGFENPPGFDPPGFNPPGFGEEPEPGGDPETPGGPNDPPFDPELPPIDVQTPPEVVPVPEPATLVLLGSGLAFVAWRARRQQSKGKGL